MSLDETHWMCKQIQIHDVDDGDWCWLENSVFKVQAGGNFSLGATCMFSTDCDVSLCLQCSSRDKTTKWRAALNRLYT